METQWKSIYKYVFAPYILYLIYSISVKIKKLSVTNKLKFMSLSLKVHAFSFVLNKYITAVVSVGNLNAPLLPFFSTKKQYDCSLKFRI